MMNQNLLKDSKAYYENNDYYEIFSKSEDALGLVDNYIKNISKNKIVLDAGCGTGKYLPTIENVSLQYIGIDLSNEQLKKAKLKSNKVNSLFINSNLSNIGLESNSIDVIVSCWVLGTITDLDEREKVLNELKRVLKKAGIIILVENDEHSEFEKIRGREDDTRTKEYNTWIINHGFKVEERFNTYFQFNDIETCKKSFNVIYGEKVSSLINSEKIEHKIILFKYEG